MELDTSCKIIHENSINESSDIVYQPQIIGSLIKELQSRSMVSDICNFVPLTQPSGFVFGLKNDSEKIEIAKTFVEVKDHIKLTTITKEVIDDIFNQYGENGIQLITALLKRDLALDQDKEVVNYMKQIATIHPNVEVDMFWIGNGQRVIETLADAAIIKMATHLKTNLSGFIIGSPKVVALLRDYSAIAVDKSKMISYVGTIGPRDMYVDYWSDEDYLIVGLNSKEEFNGITFCPYDMNITYANEYNTGANIIRVNNRYGIVRNPLDNTGENDSIFFSYFPVSFINGGDDISEFVNAFNSEITPEIDPNI